MDSDLIEPVRRFNRTVTQRIGALNEEYLARSRPLGASRVLWEIGDGADVRVLRARLDLDSGYLSRLLRRLEAEGLVRVQPAPGDHRVRVARLTEAGRRERAELDRRSDELAWSLLAPLNDRQRSRLLEAMETARKLLTAGLVQIAVADPAGRAAQFCLRSYFAELDARFDAGFDPGASIPAAADELTEPAGLFLVAQIHGEPVGCGALKLHGSEPAELKRMWVAADARGLGVGRRILAELEHHARQRGVSVVRLETNQRLTEAIGLYRSAGYDEVPAFNDEPYAHHWFAKHLNRPGA
ncbi:MAG TPA: helix-turn-helix domain-containing GNAT family N-acetyltransferase [Streptosporangiaceae bacterium]|nr:helix-turn-helix domain-containing GNAT family N-acetyltransferase [Streptosporangiaceae bacterium]